MPAVAAVNALAPLPFRRPVSVVAPVPPFGTVRVPVTAEAKGMLVRVLVDPLIDLLVTTTVLVAVYTFAGVMMFERFAMLGLRWLRVF